MTVINYTVQQPFVGYPGQVWLSCWQAISWLQTILDNELASQQTVAASTIAVYATLVNGSNSVAVYQTAGVLANEANNMAALLNLVLPLDSLSATYAHYRLHATIAAASGVAGLLTTLSPWVSSGALLSGSPAIPDPGYLLWCSGFAAETTPPGLGGASGMLQCMQQEVTSWMNVANAVQSVQGTANLDYRYDTAVRTWRAANNIYTTVTQYQSGPLSSNGATLWNPVAALPAILQSAAMLMSAPNTLLLQQASTIRYILNSTAFMVAGLLLSLRSNNSAIPSTASLNNGQSLQDLAAKLTGDAENWVSIAALNNLSPPYPGANNQALAQAGTQLLLPSAGTTPQSGLPTPTYFANVLGTDWDFGPINGTPAPWLGDIPLITGYSNFARAIGRRLQTSLGSLIYHTDYGSRIPGEIGAIQSADEAPRLLQLGVSAIKADPRTANVPYAVAAVEPGFTASFSGTVTPIGIGAQPVGIDETIGILP